MDGVGGADYGRMCFFFSLHLAIDADAPTRLLQYALAGGLGRHAALQHVVEHGGSASHGTAGMGGLQFDGAIYIYVHGAAGQ